jgi:hypothetical protein
MGGVETSDPDASSILGKKGRTRTPNYSFRRTLKKGLESTPKFELAPFNGFQTQKRKNCLLLGANANCIEELSFNRIKFILKLFKVIGQKIVKTGKLEFLEYFINICNFFIFF